MRICRWLAAGVLLLSLTACSTALWVKGPLPERAYVVLLTVSEGGASGVVVAPRRVLTAAHVVAGNDTVKVTFGGKDIDGKVLKIDRKNDLALVEAEVTCPCVSLGGKMDLDDRVVVVGYPMQDVLLGAQFVTEGSYQGEVRGFSMYSSHAAFGISGGGVFNEGKLVGIMSGMAAAPIGSFIGLPISVPVWFISFSSTVEAIKSFLA